MKPDNDETINGYISKELDGLTIEELEENKPELKDLISKVRKVPVKEFINSIRIFLIYRTYKFMVILSDLLTKALL